MSQQIKADLFLLLITAIWGASFTLMKNVLEVIPSFAYLSLRFIIASLVLVVIYYKSLKKVNKKVIIYGFIIGLMLFGGMALQVTGLYFTTASNSAFITGLNVVMVPIVSSFLLKKKPDVYSAIGVILAFAGMFVLSVGESFFNREGIKLNIGDFLTFLCAICFTLQIIFIDKFTNEQDPTSLAVIQIGFAAVMYTMVWLGLDFKPFEINSTVIITLIITGVLGTALAFAGQTVVQRFTSPTHTALILAAEPLFGALFALVIPNSQGVTESLKINSILGCALILIGMLISELKVGKRNNS